MIQVEFVTEAYIKKTLPQNIDMAKLTPHISTAQDVHIRDLLGDNLYNRLALAIKNSIDGSPIVAIPSDDDALLELIRPCLTYYVFYEAIPFLATSINNIGITSTTDDKQQKADALTIEALSTRILGKAQYYQKRIQNYLYTNASKYVEYSLPNTDVNPNKSKGYSSEIFLDDNFISESFIKRYTRE